MKKEYVEESSECEGKKVEAKEPCTVLCPVLCVLRFYARVFSTYSHFHPLKVHMCVRIYVFYVYIKFQRELFRYENVSLV